VEKITIKKYPIGTSVKLVSYEEYPRFKDQIAKIVGYSPGTTLNYKIHWTNGEVSYLEHKNTIPILSWKERYTGEK